MLRIYLRSYLDNNLGDDLMVQGIVNRFPNFNFYVVSSNSVIQNTYKEFKNLHFISEKEFFKNITRDDVYLKLGGSIFQYRSYIQMIRKYIGMMKLRKLKRKGAKTVVLGSNLGPFAIKGSKYLAKKELNMYDFVTVRDTSSNDIIKKEFKLKNAKKFDDIVFELMDSEFYKSKAIKSNDKTLGISAYRSVTNKNNYDFYLAIAKQIYNLNQIEKFSSIKIFAFDSEIENDLSAAHHIKEILVNKYQIKSEIIPYLGSNINTFLNEFSGASYMITVRFHSAILSDYFGIPHYPISYSNKMEEYINDNYSNKSTLSVREFIDSNQTLDLNQFVKRDNDVKKGHLENFSSMIRLK